jgi:hypothetical protein
MAVIKIVPFPGPAGSDGNGDTGDITFDGVKIIGAGTASGDDQSNSTIEIVPDADLYVNDQYLIIDPTNPNHIHIRAGGTQDESNADLILGGEKNNVYIEDDARQVSINTRPDTISNNYVNDNLTSSTTFVTSNASDINIDYVVNVGGTDYLVDAVTNNSPTEGLLSVTASGAAFTAGNTYTFTYESLYTNYWQFGSDGYLSGPAMGGLLVSGILNGENDLWLSSNDNVVLNGNEGGEFIGNADDPENQIATIGDLGGDTSFTVVGGTLGTQPTFTGAPLFTGSYVKTGPMVHFRIDVDMDNITNFGTGQYYVDLPFPSKYNYQFAAGCYHDISTGRDYPMFGHVEAGESRVVLKSIDAGGNSAYNVPFTSTQPVTLNAEDNFHISGDYIALDGV